MSALKEPKNLIALTVGALLSVVLFVKTGTASFAGVPVLLAIVSAAIALVRGQSLRNASREGATTFIVVLCGAACLLFVVAIVQMYI